MVFYQYIKHRYFKNRYINLSNIDVKTILPIPSVHYHIIVVCIRLGVIPIDGHRFLMRWIRIGPSTTVIYNYCDAHKHRRAFTSISTDTLKPVVALELNYYIFSFTMNTNGGSSFQTSVMPLLIFLHMRFETTFCYYFAVQLFINTQSKLFWNRNKMPIMHDERDCLVKKCHKRYDETKRNGGKERRM
jgi:hypothetical protein